MAARVSADLASAVAALAKDGIAGIQAVERDLQAHFNSFNSFKDLHRAAANDVPTFTIGGSFFIRSDGSDLDGSLADHVEKAMIRVETLFGSEMEGVLRKYQYSGPS